MIILVAFRKKHYGCLFASVIKPLLEILNTVSRLLGRPVFKILPACF